LKFGRETPCTGNVFQSVLEQKVNDQWFLQD
jgi:hypothetical protein